MCNEKESVLFDIQCMAWIMLNDRARGDLIMIVKKTLPIQNKKMFIFIFLYLMLNSFSSEVNLLIWKI